ncbi:MAG: molybdopterin synthase [Candidatus Methanoperedens sp.]|jgi:molybdopterin synthase catalytic subunit|nr:molybdopterin synthase [Candidatus Methanoperedens sp.]PKL53425.1 MAG: molybdopterin synthase [Candidatus Methanoperedenaceae archaeon HGW-Methanoperedenaceae-1]
MKVISVVGYKKSGKTTLVERLVSSLRKHGTVGTVKHLHEHNIGQKGTDTQKHTEAGADVVVAVTKGELVKFSKNNTLAAALDELADSGMDFGVVEGFKDSSLPKIALGSIETTNVIEAIEKPEDADIGKLVNIIMELPEYHTLESLVRKIRAAGRIEQAGAIGTFTGIVREVTGNTKTEYLEFEEYAGIARAKLDNICSELKAKDGITDVLIHHRTGIIRAGEDIVYIVVAAGHREQLFPVLRDAIERLKEEVPIWKKEHTLESEWWVHDSEK